MLREFEMIMLLKMFSGVVVTHADNTIVLLLYLLSF